ncbi:MAG: hypothetical protein AAB935_02050, partial [Patescibacteria group bacterium]
NSVIGVIGVRTSTSDIDYLTHPGVLGCTESREESDVNQYVRKLTTHRAPPFRHLADMLVNPAS